MPVLTMAIVKKIYLVFILIEQTQRLNTYKMFVASTR